MSDKYVLATDDNGDLAVRTVTAEESPTANSTDIITATTDGKLAVRVVGASGGGGGGDQHNLGWYATESALTTAHPTASAGDFAIVGSTDTVWVWDTDNEEWVDSDQKGQVTSVNGQTGAVTVDTLPSQTGQSGKFLTTDGTDASWSDKPLVNTATGAQDSLTILGTPNNSNNATNIGFSTSVTKKYSIVVGHAASVTGQASYLFGTGTVSADTSAVFGIGTVTATGATLLSPKGGYTNSDANTFKVGNANGNYEMMSADGTIPTARLTKVNTTITLAAADWSAGTQTVTVNGVTSTSVVFVAPDPADTTDYVSAGILCTSQGTNSLTFTATTTPSADIDVVVVAM